MYISLRSRCLKTKALSEFAATYHVDDKDHVFVFLFNVAKHAWCFAFSMPTLLSNYGIWRACWFREGGPSEHYCQASLAITTRSMQRVTIGCKHGICSSTTEPLSSCSGSPSIVHCVCQQGEHVVNMCIQYALWAADM